MRAHISYYGDIVLDTTIYARAWLIETGCGIKDGVS